MTERASTPPQIYADRNRGTGQAVAHLAQTAAALTMQPRQDAVIGGVQLRRQALDGELPPARSSTAGLD